MSYSLLKRFFEIIICIIILPVIIPIILLFSILIIIDSPGSPFFLQRRLGLNGKEFMIYKLRSMRSGTEDVSWTKVSDSRITKVGQFIRAKRIDELPQIINVLKGDMSFIGPRPERPELVAEFLREIPEFNQRLAVKPGITGYAQIKGGYDLSPKEKLELDNYYIQNKNIKLDLHILLKTIAIVFTGHGAR